MLTCHLERGALNWGTASIRLAYRHGCGAFSSLMMDVWEVGRAQPTAGSDTPEQVVWSSRSSNGSKSVGQNSPIDSLASSFRLWLPSVMTHDREIQIKETLSSPSCFWAVFYHSNRQHTSTGPQPTQLWCNSSQCSYVELDWLSWRCWCRYEHPASHPKHSPGSKASFQQTKPSLYSQEQKPMRWSSRSWKMKEKLRYWKSPQDTIQQISENELTI